MEAKERMTAEQVDKFMAGVREAFESGQVPSPYGGSFVANARFLAKLREHGSLCVVFNTEDGLDFVVATAVSMPEDPAGVEALFEDEGEE